jgi:hypothetical protein
MVDARIRLDSVRDGLMHEVDFVMIPVDSHTDHASIPELATRA